MKFAANIIKNAIGLSSHNTDRVSLFVFIIVSLFTPISYANDSDFWVLTSLEPPFTQKNQRGAYEGLNVEIVNGILAEAAIEQKILAAPWERVLKEAQTKADVLIFALARTPEREQQFHWISPLSSNIVGIFSLTGSTNSLSKLSDIAKDSKIGVIESDFRHDLLQQAKVSNIRLISDWAQGVNDLLDKRLNLLFFSSMGMQFICQQQQRDCSSVKRVLTYQQTTSYLAMSKLTDSHVVETLKAAAIRFKQSLQFKHVTQKWMHYYRINNGLSMHEDQGIINLWPQDE